MNWGEARGFAGSCVRPNCRGCICLTFLRCVFSNVSSKLNWGGGTWLRRHPCVRPNYRGCPGDTRGRCSSPAWSTIDWFYTSSVKRPPPAGLWQESSLCCVQCFWLRSLLVIAWLWWRSTFPGLFVLANQNNSASFPTLIPTNWLIQMALHIKRQLFHRFLFHSSNQTEAVPMPTEVQTNKCSLDPAPTKEFSKLTMLKIHRNSWHTL